MSRLGKRSRSRCLGIFAFLLVLALPAGHAQPAFLAADINTTLPEISPFFFLDEGFAVLETNLFFLADDGIHGVELWKTDGTAAGTAMVEDICPGVCWGRPHSLTVAGGALYFGAYDGAHGSELWKSDGTAAGTSLVKDILPGGEGSVSSLREVAGSLVFSAHDGIHGEELWTTDGTAAGTQMIFDLRPGPLGSEPRPRIVVNGDLLFWADDGAHGREPWLTDGTATGTRMLRDVASGPAGSFAEPATSFESNAVALPGGSFLFAAYDLAHGVELWTSDGTEAGTALVADANPGSGGSDPFGLTALGSIVLYSAWDPVRGRELWKTDGTGAGTAIVKDLDPAAASSPRELHSWNGRLYFRAYDGAHGVELWTSDGTAAGTFLVKDVNPGPSDGFSGFFRSPLESAGSALLFHADDGVHGLELWKTDGSEAGTALVQDILPGALTSYAQGTDLQALGSHLHFYAFGPDGLSLWKSDGSAAGTAQVKDLATLASSILVLNGGLMAATSSLGGTFVFPADDGTGHGTEPWRTDGTPAGTRQIADLSPGTLSSFPHEMLRHGNRLLMTDGYLWSTDGTGPGTSLLSGPSASFLESALGTVFFSNQEDSTGSELWTTDGTAAGTALLKDIRPGSPSSSPGRVVPLGSAALFAATDGTQGRELWTTDGTAAGTVLLTDLRPGSGSSDPTRLIRAGGQVFFFAQDATSREKLWRTDGTAAGTTVVKDLVPGSGSYFPSNPRTLASRAETLFFVVNQDVFLSSELWKTDGTAAGTVLVKEIVSGYRSSSIDLLTRVRDRVFFVADDGAHGRELWVSDGTAAGTRMVEDVVPGEGSSRPANLKAAGHVLLFSAFDPDHGVELWVSDGTEAGTRLLQDIAPGALPSSPLAFTPAGDKVGFAANDGIAGFEPWTLPRAALGSTFADVPPGHWAWLSVEALADAGITRGCAAGSYCPGAVLTRAEAAVFLGRATHSEGYAPPPPTGTRFGDVAAGFWAADWIEQIAADGITQGCSASPALFCPGSQLSRAEMAILLLRARHGGGYAPPPATGTRFTDVPINHWAAAWIEQLAAEGISLGCTPTRFCTGSLVTRAEMAVFLTRTFGLGM